MANDNSKDIANSLNKYTDYAHKGTNLVLDSAENINKWYAEQLNKITESDVDTSRIETGVDNSIEANDIANKNEKVALLLDESSSMGSSDKDPFTIGKTLMASMLCGLDKKNVVGYLWATTPREVSIDKSPMKFVKVFVFL